MDDLDTIRRNADRVLAQLTDYKLDESPSVIAKAVYLHEASLRMELRPEVLAQLYDLRWEIAIAVGIERG